MAAVGTDQILNGYREQVLKLRAGYPVAERVYGKQLCSYQWDNSVETDSFWGSASIVNISSLDSITLEAPACVAAPLVSVVAKNAINLGMKRQGAEIAPVHFYAPKQLTLSTRHLSVGDISIMIDPKRVFIMCKKLTLLKPKGEESKSSEKSTDLHEMLKSWAGDDVEVETLS